MDRYAPGVSDRVEIIWVQFFAAEFGSPVFRESISVDKLWKASSPARRILQALGPLPKG